MKPATPLTPSIKCMPSAVSDWDDLWLSRRQTFLTIFSLLIMAVTAACYKKKAFDGSPISCYCPVYRDRSYLIGAPKGAGKPTCKVTLPYVLSGVTNFLPGSLGGARV